MTIASRLAVLLALLGAAGCSERAPADRDTSELHRRHSMNHVIGQRYVTCDDGARADLDFLGDGLSMAVTWLPSGRREVLTAPKTGQPYTNGRTLAIVAGGTIAFQHDRRDVHLCRRPE